MSELHLPSCSAWRVMGLLLAAALWTSTAAQAQSATSTGAGYPSRPIRLIVPMPPGGGTDFWARVTTAKMSEILGQAIVVDNRPGAGTMIGADVAAKAAADGYTLLIGDVGTYSVNGHLYRKIAYDPLKDFVPVTLTSRQGLVLVVPAGSSIQTAPQLVAAARAQAGRLNYGSASVGSPHHLAMELFQKTADIHLNHVPYKGGAPLANDMVGGQLDVAFMDVPSAMPHLKSGRIRALAVASGSRLEALPGIATLAESGFPGFEAEIWQGMVAPAGTSPQIVAALNAAYAKASADAEVRRKLLEVGVEATPSSSAALASQIRSESGKWGVLIRELKISAD